MSVELHYLGRLGNQLFEYAFARIIAERFGLELTCRTIEELGETYGDRKFAGKKLDEGSVATMHGLAEYFVNAPQHLPGRRVSAPIERLAIDDLHDGKPWLGQVVDFQKLLADPSERGFFLRGYFQRWEYFREHAKTLRHWFALPPLDDPYGITKNDIFLNIRRGYDYAINGWVLSLTAYKKLLSEVPHERVFVCGTGIDDAVKETLREFSPIYYQSKPIDEFRFIGKFDKIVQSNSSFCWWAAWLSNASAIYTPRPDKGYFSSVGMNGEVALDPGESRYRYFDAVVAGFIPFERNPQAKLRLEGEELIIEAEQGALREKVKPEMQPFFAWLLEQNAPFGPREIALAGVLPQSKIEPVTQALVAKGALLASLRFYDR